MKTKKRSFVIGVSVLSLVVLLLVSFTLAYLTDQRNTLNILGIGTDGSSGENVPTVRIKLTEPGFAASEGVKTTVMNPGAVDEYSKVELYNILPGQKVDKDPTITNTGAEAVYVRVKLTNAEGTVTDLSADPMDVFGAEINSNWTYKNGYWYLNAPLAVDASVSLLKNRAATGAAPFTMMIPEGENNETLADLIGIVNLNVTAEAIQSRGFTPDMNHAEPWNLNGTAVPIIPAIRG